jgi:hypothetical protein
MRGYIVFQVSSGEHWTVKKYFERLVKAAIEWLANRNIDTPGSLDLLRGDNMRWWGQSRQRHGIQLQIWRQLIPPLL